MGIYFVTFVFQDDAEAIKRDVYSLEQANKTIADIEFLSNDTAIAFYEHDLAGIPYFGEAILKKGIFGWKTIHSGSSQTNNGYKLGWGFTNLEQFLPNYTDLISGKILNPQIKKVEVVSEKGETYQAAVIEYDNGEKFWFLVTNGKSLLDATIRGLSSDGEIIEQIER